MGYRLQLNDLKNLQWDVLQSMRTRTYYNAAVITGDILINVGYSDSNSFEIYDLNAEQSLAFEYAFDRMLEYLAGVVSEGVVTFFGGLNMAGGEAYQARNDYTGFHYTVVPSMQNT